MTATATQVRTTRVPLFALLAANAISTVGSAMTTVALPWFVLQTTDSPAKAGLTGFFVALPLFVAGIFGGTIVDRLGFKRACVIADLVSGFGIVLIPLLYHTIGLAFWQLLGLVFLGALLAIPGLTARRSLLPELADLAGIRLERVNAAYEANQYLSLLIGPPIAGLLIAWFDASNVLWIDAVSFFLSAALVAAFVVAPPRQAVARGRYLDELGAGLRFLWNDRLLFWLAISLVPGNILGAPFFAVILPVYARATLGDATDLGLMIGATGAGSLVGATVFGAIGHRLPRRWTWLVGFLVAPVEYWILTLEPPLALIVLTLFFGAAMSGAINPLLVTIRHERIPASMRGRVFSTFSAISSGMQPLGMIAGGNLVEAIGLHSTVLAFAAISQLFAVAMLFVPVYREMNRSRSHTSEAPFETEERRK